MEVPLCDLKNIRFHFQHKNRTLRIKGKFVSFIIGKKKEESTKITFSPALQFILMCLVVALNFDGLEQT